MPDLLQQFLSPGVTASTLEDFGTGSGDFGSLAISDPTALSGAELAASLELLGAGGATLGASDPTFDGSPIPEPQRVYDFRVRLPAIGVSIPFVEGVDVNIVEATTQSPEPIGGRHRYVAGTYDAAPLTLILYHNQASQGVAGHIALDYIHHWQGLVQNDDGTYNYPETYLFSIYIDFWNVNHNVGYTLQYRKCFPLTVSPVPMRFNRSDRTAITVTFSCERILRTAVGSVASWVSSLNPQIEEPLPFDQTVLNPLLNEVPQGNEGITP